MKLIRYSLPMVRDSHMEHFETEKNKSDGEAVPSDGGWIAGTLRNIFNLQAKIDRHRFLLDLMCFYVMYTVMILMHHSMRGFVFDFIGMYPGAHRGTWYNTIWNGFDYLMMNELPLLAFPVLITGVVFWIRDHCVEGGIKKVVRWFAVFVVFGVMLHVISTFRHVLSPILLMDPVK